MHQHDPPDRPPWRKDLGSHRNCERNDVPVLAKLGGIYDTPATRKRVRRGTIRQSVDQGVVSVPARGGGLMLQPGRMTLVGATYLERGRPVTVLVQWRSGHGRGPAGP